MLLMFFKPFGTEPHQDNFVTRSLKRLKEQTSEQEMWVDGEFVSEADMKDRLKLSELLGCSMVQLSCIETMGGWMAMCQKSIL